MDAPTGEGTLGEVIRRRRQELGWSQEELAERASVDGDEVRQSDVSRLEAGKVALPRRARLERIAAALGLPLGDLLARSGWAGAVESFDADSAPAPPVARPDVLLVDDEPAVADALADLLMDEGYRVELAYDARTALAAVDRRAPALVVTDAMMAPIDGIALATELRARPEPVPVVLIGVGRPHAQVPDVPFVPKPVDRAVFLAVVGAALAGNRERG